jgi:hypothetical protein
VKKIPGAFSRRGRNGFGLVEDTKDLNTARRFSTITIVSIVRVLTESSQAGSVARTFLLHLEGLAPRRNALEVVNTELTTRNMINKIYKTKGLNKLLALISHRV